MPFDDELPSAPVPDGATDVSFDDNIDASSFEGVGKVGDAMPKGTYHFRMESYSMRLSNPTDVEKAAGKKAEPYFAMQWKCQEEPLTGRVLFDNVPWVDAKDVVDANNSKSPRQSEAKGILGNRLVRANSIMAAAGFKPTGQFGFRQFLDSHPELKIQVSVAEKKDKNPATGKYDVPTGEMQNRIVKYASLTAPR